MRNIRIIPRLDVKGPNLVKGIRFEGLRVLGPPEYFARRYYNDGADEIIYMDIVASLYGRNNLREIVERTAKRVFIPITVGGGIRTIDDIREILRAGADKVAINTAVINNPSIISDGARIFGSQCIVVSIEAKRTPDGKYEAFTDNGRQETGVDVFEWTRKVCALGAGEILVTSVDREGTGEGYDTDLIARIADIATVPVIACGGAGNLNDFKKVVEGANVSAVSAASVFHYHEIDKGVIDNKYEEGNIEFLKEYILKSGPRLKRIHPVSVAAVKEALASDGMRGVRPLAAASGDSVRSCDPVPADGRHFIVVVDYGCGNLFSIEHAMKEIGAKFAVSGDPAIIRQADRILIPGVGAFGVGMESLNRRGLAGPVRDHVLSGRPVLGICLGMQLLMGESEEFGRHEGFGFIRGKTVRLAVPAGSVHKVPHIGWSSIRARAPHGDGADRDQEDLWRGTPLEDVPQGSLMYFVHSYAVAPDDPANILAETEYAGMKFCSAVSFGNLYGCQFHPERSGELGLSIYRRFVSMGRDPNTSPRPAATAPEARARRAAGVSGGAGAERI